MSKLNGMIEESKPAPGDYRDNQRIIELDSDDSMGDSEDFAGRLISSMRRGRQRVRGNGRQPTRFVHQAYSVAFKVESSATSTSLKA
ncbi:hypothetical protein PF004_g840 [Phytophthora fragariae]|uniref:Uncharacterized protein n=1 Tax=Phytophthora fragariae TaxID=53985 RepID=A0A6G0PUL8_9STRA|nr:hypothetical protein PF004_g840 [Phytophthora fragariae]